VGDLDGKEVVGVLEGMGVVGVMDGLEVVGDLVGRTVGVAEGTGVDPVYTHITYVNVLQGLCAIFNALDSSKQSPTRPNTPDELVVHVVHETKLLNPVPIPV
jgi:hypothetical protein